MPKKQEGSLGIYRVLDLTDNKGTYCTKLLADQGAEVIKIEPPEGDPARSYPPFAEDEICEERSLFFLYRNANKFGITLDLESPDGKDILCRLVKSADVLVESFHPGYLEGLGLGYDSLKAINPGLVMASITDFGQTGPYRDWKGSDMVHFALSTTMITSGFPDRPPCNLPGTPSYDSACLIASISISTALYQRGSNGGEGQYIDVSVHECSRLGLYPWTIAMYSYNVNPGMPEPPPEGRFGAMVYPVYPCKDGYVRVIALTPRQWDGLLKVLNYPEVLMMPEWREFMYRIGNAADLYALMLEITTQYTMVELFEAGHREGVPIVPIWNVKDFIDSDHTKARKFFVDVEHPVVGKYKMPGPPYRWSETPCKIRQTAPTLGEHNEMYYRKELGFSKQELSALKRANVI